MSVYLRHADGSLELTSPDLSEGELLKMREELDASSIPASPVIPPVIEEVL